MIKRIEFVDDKDMFELDSDENSEEEFETQKIKNINHDVEKAVVHRSPAVIRRKKLLKDFSLLKKLNLKKIYRQRLEY